MSEIIIGFGFILGLVIGSLVYCIALRSIGVNSFWGRSYCESCKHRLYWYDLFPIFSYINLGGKCRYCLKKISPEYPLFELLMGLIVAYIFFVNIKPEFLNEHYLTLGFRFLELIFKIFAVSIFVSVFVTDIKTGLIPDRITYPSIVIVLVLMVIVTIYKIFLFYQSLLSSTIGKYLLPPYSDYFYRHSIMMIQNIGVNLITAFGIGLFFLLLIILTKGRGMGGGDMKFGVFMGLSLGFPNGLIGLALAFIIGSIVGLGLIIFKIKKLKQTIPFGPFLSLGSLLSLLWGPQILDFYNKMTLL